MVIIIHQNEYKDNVSGSSLTSDNVRLALQHIQKRGVEYTKEIDEINKSRLSFMAIIIHQLLINRYCLSIQLNASTTYFIYSNKYARGHGAKNKIVPDKCCNEFLYSDGFKSKRILKLQLTSIAYSDLGIFLQ